MILGGHLSPKFNHIRTIAEQGKSLLGSPHSSGKDAGKHDALNALCAIGVNDVEQPVSELNLGRLLNENRYGLPHCSTLPLATTRLSEIDDHFVDGTLTKASINALSTTRDDSTARRAAGCPSAAHTFALADL